MGQRKVGMLARVVTVVDVVEIVSARLHEGGFNTRNKRPVSASGSRHYLTHAGTVADSRRDMVVSKNTSLKFRPTPQTLSSLPLVVR